MKKENRIWEIDAIRGHLILWVLLFHLYITLCSFFINGRYSNVDAVAFAQTIDPLHLLFVIRDGIVQRGFFQKIMEITEPPGVDLFFIISGISCVFSRNNLKSGIRLLIAAYVISAFTYGLSVWTGDPTQFIRFGALQCYAYCHLIYVFLLEKRNNKTLLILSIPIFIVGYFFRYHPVYSNFAILYPFGISEIGAAGGDWWPIFPMLGWFLLGAVIGRKYYAEKKSLLPYPKAQWLTRPLQWLGRYSGIIYVSHIVIYPAVFCGIGYLLNIY